VTDGKIDREGIHIDRELAETLHIEEELDSNVVGVYRFPSPERRKTSGAILFGFGFISFWAIPFPAGSIVAAALIALGCWMFVSAWPLKVDEQEALRVAGTKVPFAVGHASASVRFKGWRSRPRWSVVVYSATEPPDARGLVVVDAVSGEVVEDPYFEPIEPV